MTLGALLEIVGNENYLIEELKKLNVDGYKIEISKKIKNGITGTYVDVILQEEYSHGHHHDHEHHGHHHHHADEVFGSWGMETVKKYNARDLKVRLDALGDADTYGMVLRAKGMVEGDKGTWIYFDMVPGEVELREGQPDYTGRICVIGSRLKESALKDLFAGASE